MSLSLWYRLKYIESAHIMLEKFSKMKSLKSVGLVLAAGLVLSSCAGSSDNNDPYENYNRSIFSFNKAVDDAVINPTIAVYRIVVPSPLRAGFSNFLYHLNSPIRLANQLLQGDLDGAGNELVRAIVNTFVGVGGIFDVAEYEGLARESEDFGQTLGVWGVDHGPYLVVPFLGPSSLRDYVGFAVDAYFDPIRYYANNVDEQHLFYTKMGLTYFDLRDGLRDVLEELEASSVDYYAAVRSTYFQSRDALVRDNEASEEDPFDIPDYDDDF